jgi:purine-cytosine permease-like protein
MDINVSPAAYTPHTPTYSRFMQTTLSPAFRQPIYGTPLGYSNCMVRTKTGLKATPGNEI